MYDGEYVYEGHSKVVCSRCNFEHEVFFTGDDNYNPREAINMVLLEEGWEVEHMVCPECYSSGDLIEEKRILDEMEEELIYDDDYEDSAYDEEDDDDYEDSAYDEEDDE
jgi:hypothetical protein